MTPEATWIPLITKLQGLKNLKLHASSIPVDCFWAMNAIGRGCKDLEELTLGTPGGDIGYGILESFSQHSNLECLRIGSDSMPSSSLILILIIYPIRASLSSM